MRSFQTEFKSLSEFLPEFYSRRLHLMPGGFRRLEMPLSSVM
jgi:hypothetical protein